MKAITQLQIDALPRGSDMWAYEGVSLVCHYLALVQVENSTHAVILDETGPGCEVEMTPYRVQGNQLWFTQTGTLSEEGCYAFRNRVTTQTETDDLRHRITTALKNYKLLGENDELNWSLVSSSSWYRRGNHLSLVTRRQNQAIQREAVSRQKKQPPNVVPEGVFIQHRVVLFLGGVTLAYRILPKEEGGAVIQFGTSLFRGLDKSGTFQRRIGTRFALKALEERGGSPLYIHSENYGKTPAGQIEMKPDKHILDQVIWAIGEQLDQNRVFNLLQGELGCVAIEVWTLLPTSKSYPQRIKKEPLSK